MSEAGDPVTAYLEHARSLIDRVLATQLSAIERAGDLVAAAIAADALVHVFGSGHSHMLAEEFFYRAGGLAAVDPILRDELMLHRSAVESTVFEREPGRGTAIFESLTRGEAAVKDLTARFAISQPAISQHLAALKDAGLVNGRRELPARVPRRRGCLQSSMRRRAHPPQKW